MKNHPTVAAFDFDGTITYCDSLVPFLWSISGTSSMLKHLFLELPNFGKYLCGYKSRQEIKEIILGRFLKKRQINEVRVKGAAYAKGFLLKLLRREAINRIGWHKKQGHTLVLISANLDVYLEPCGKDAGFDHIISSRLEVDNQGQITGKLIGKNCWGEEKVERLIEFLGPKKEYVLFAYGDSPGDEALLKCADYPYYRSFPH